MSMSSKQWRGGGGSSSGAMVIRSSVPHTLQRYRTLMRRISPDGGGGGNVDVIDLSMPKPNFHTNRIMMSPPINQMTADKVGIAAKSAGMRLVSRGVR